MSEERVDTALILAMAENRVIGKDNRLPWHIPGELKYFKQVTMGKPLLMGRRTFESIGRPLPGRLNIVVTRRPDFRAEGVEVYCGVEPALERARRAARELGVSEVMVIGGAQLYAALLPLADRIYLTEVHFSVDGDTHFPPLGEGWRETRRRDVPASEDAPACSFVVLERA